MNDHFFLLLLLLKTIMLLHIFVQTIILYFRILWWIWNSKQYLKYKSFVMNVFAVTSGQLNAFLLILFLLLSSHSILFSFNMASRVTSLCSTRLIFMTTGSGFMTWPQEVITGLKSSPSRGQISARPHLKTSLLVRISQSMFLKQWPLILFSVMLSTFGIINKYRWEIQCTNTY